MMKRRFSRPRFTGRRHVNSEWVGYNWLGYTLTPGTITAFPLFDSADAGRVNSSGNVRPRRSLVHLSLQYAGAAFGSAQLFWYITQFETDLAQAVPSALFVDPSAADTDLFSKHMLNMGTHRLAVGASTALFSDYSQFIMNRTLDVKPRATKLESGQDELYFVIVNVAAAGNDVSLQMQTRTYCQWG